MPREDLQVPKPLGSTAQYVEDSSEKASALALTDKGNIGVATKEPESPLHVSGDLRIGRRDRFILGDKGQGVGEWITNTKTGGFGIAFHGKGKERARITNDGRVGIGTKSPQGALDVFAAGSKPGALIVPRVTKQQRNALSKVEGSVVYNTDDKRFNFCENGQWVTYSPMPKISTGVTRPEDWKPYTAPHGNGDGIFVDVDTSAASFAETPHYLTTLEGGGGRWVTCGVTSIYNSTPQGFRVYLRWADTTYGGGGSNTSAWPNPVTADAANKRGWFVRWTGMLAS